MQEVLDNALILFAVLALGAIATVFGSRVVFVAAPPLVILIVVWLIQMSFRLTDQTTPDARRVVRALLDSSEARLAAPADAGPVAGESDSLPPRPS